MASLREEACPEKEGAPNEPQTSATSLQELDAQAERPLLLLPGVVAKYGNELRAHSRRAYFVVKVGLINSSIDRFI